MKTPLALATATLLTLAPLHADEPHSKDIVETAVAAGSFETLAAALGAADLVGALQGDGPFTVFAPTDEAFAKLPKATLQALLLPVNKSELIKVLTYHVVPGRVSAQQAVAAVRATSLQKSELSFRIDAGRFIVNDAAVLTNDIACSNGVIHVIDSVLLPPGDLDLRPAGRLIIGVHTEKPSRALAAQLGFERNGALLLTGITKGNMAEKAGLEKYDVVLTIDGQPATEGSLKQGKQRAGYGGHLELQIIRRGKHHTITVEVGIDSH